MATTTRSRRQAPVEHDEELALLARALGHPARVRILRLLCSRDTCVAGELTHELPLAASTVSQHLKVLKAAGLIDGEVDGPRRCYQPGTTAIARLAALVAELRPHKNKPRSCR